MTNSSAQLCWEQKPDGATVLLVADPDTRLVHQNLLLVQVPIPQYLSKNGSRNFVRLEHITVFINTTKQIQKTSYTTVMLISTYQVIFITGND
jgi:hypothetical protein